MCVCVCVLPRSLASPQILLKLFLGLLSLDASLAVLFYQWECASGGLCSTHEGIESGAIGLLSVVIDFFNHCFSVFKLSEHTLHTICAAIQQCQPALQKRFFHVVQRGIRSATTSVGK